MIQKHWLYHQRLGASLGWHMVFRLYGPEKAWFDKTWWPSEVELIK